MPSSVSYLPAPGDQFSTLTDGGNSRASEACEQRSRRQWNINPKLLLTTAVYDLNRYNVPLPDPNNPGFFILSGSNRIRGFETSLNGYITDSWQSTLGYAYTDARVTSATSATIVAGNRIQLVPYNQFSWWNKYQITPVWGAALGFIYFFDSLASSDDSVKLPGFFRVDAALYLKINEMWKPNSMSKTSSTKAIGHRRTATTTCRQASRAPSESQQSPGFDRRTP
jgi:catecholate siderophore receptor